MNESLGVAVAILLVTAVIAQPIALYALVLAIALGAIALSVGLAKGIPLPQPSRLILLAYAVLLMSGLLSGGLALQDLARPSFYDTDGRIILYYLPVVLLATVRIGPRGMRTFASFLAFAGALISLMLALWALDLDAGVFSRAGLFTGLVNHKTAAGTAYLVISIALLALGKAMGKKHYVALSLSVFAASMATGSRQVLVGLLSLVVLSLLTRTGVRRLLTPTALAVLAVAAALAVPMLLPNTAERVSRIFQDEPGEAISIQLSRPGWSPDRSISAVVAGGAEFNLLGRLAYNKRATELATDSLLVGAGFGRYNDILNPDCLSVDFSPAICLRGGQRIDSTANAHNSILHFMSEIGAVGTFLILLFWLRLFQAVLEKSDQAEDPAVVGMGVAAQSAILMLPGSSLLGHALGAPGLGIPILTLAALTLAAQEGSPRLSRPPAPRHMRRHTRTQLRPETSMRPPRQMRGETPSQAIVAHHKTNNYDQ